LYLGLHVKRDKIAQGYYCLTPGVYSAKGGGVSDRASRETRQVAAFFYAFGVKPRKTACHFLRDGKL